jgi:NADH/NAD ratio-sensing transcriptional regulator Rex
MVEQQSTKQQEAVVVRQALVLPVFQLPEEQVGQVVQFPLLVRQLPMQEAAVEPETQLEVLVVQETQAQQETLVLVLAEMETLLAAAVEVHILEQTQMAALAM